MYSHIEVPDFDFELVIDRKRERASYSGVNRAGANTAEPEATRATFSSSRLPSAIYEAYPNPDPNPTLLSLSMATISHDQAFGQPVPHLAPDASPIKPESTTPPREQHRRGYQACQPCRQRKVKCDLGSVDNPGSPPCLRCRREHKECVFSETRRKRKSSQGGDDQTLTGVHGYKRQLTTSTSFEGSSNGVAPTNQYSASPSYSTNTTSPNAWPSLPAPTIHASPSDHHSSGTQALRRAPAYTSSVTSAPVDTDRTNGNHMLNKAAADALYPAIATSHEALHLLSMAAGQTEEANRQNTQNRAGLLRSPSATFGSPGSAGASNNRTISNTMTPGHPGLIDPAIAMPDGHIDGAPNDDDYNTAVRAWSRMRFVRAGWFTAREAMSYLDYYYEHLAPLTPIVTPDFRPPSTHLTLLTEEPILAIALLAISSRHMKLLGPGAESRAYSIHDKLWTYLQCMVERLLWGQEQFGGGLCGGGSVKVHESKSGQITWKGSLRTLGTVEAILLLTDWHPRALHFPPGDDENRLLDTDYNLLKDTDGPKTDDGDFDQADSTGRVAYSSWLEPAWRSDRMSWMLLGLAQALSFELGVFNKDSCNCENNRDGSSECIRKRRLRRLVLVYVSQNSGRLGIPPMLPFAQWENDPIFDQTHRVQKHGEEENPVDIMQSRWLHIAGIMYLANERIFPSREFTRDLTSSGQYNAAIANFMPLLRGWKAQFDSVASQIPPIMRNLLTMEYEYARCYVNSLGLQKVVESWVKISNEAASSANNMSSAKSGVGVASAGSGAVSFSLLLEIFKPNKGYIEEVADAARTILKCVVEGLAPGEHLRHAPVRTYFRVLSGLMFTLKRFSFGASEGDIRESLDLLDQTTDFLSKCVVDDVHLSSQTGSLVKLLVSNIRKTFIRIQAPSGGSDKGSREPSRTHTPHRQENGPEFQAAQQYQQGGTTFVHKTDHTREDPLAGIQAQPMTDFSNVTYMPPLNYNVYMNGASSHVQSDPTVDPSINDDGAFSTDWFALPLDNIFNSSLGIVDQGFGGIGPTVGDRDMLELITNEQYDRWNGVEATTPGGFQQDGAGR